MNDKYSFRKIQLKSMPKIEGNNNNNNNNNNNENDKK